MKVSELKQIIKEEIVKALAENQIKEEDGMAGMLNRLNKNKSLKVDDITTIKSGKYKGKKVKIVADTLLLTQDSTLVLPGHAD